MSEWQTIESAPKIQFDAEYWDKSGIRLLLCNGPGGWVYFGSFEHTKTGKGRWKSDAGYACWPKYWKEAPAPPEA